MSRITTEFKDPELEAEFKWDKNIRYGAVHVETVEVCGCGCVGGVIAMVGGDGGGDE